MKVILVGCTHAGTAAVKNMLTLYDDVEVTVYERNDNISFLSCGIALYVGGVVKDKNGLFYSNPAELKEMGATVKMEHEVLSIDSNAQTMQVKDLNSGEVFEDSYDKLIMTTGSWPVIPPIPGRESKQVLLCKNFNQANVIIEKAKDAHKVAVIGGGYIGIELIEAFANQGKEVTLVDGVDRVLSKYLDANVTDVLEEEIKNHGITLALGQTVNEFVLNEDGSLRGIKTSKGEFEADLAILCVGFRPNTDLLKGQVDMLPNGAIKIDRYMRTSNPNIFAGGDSTCVIYNPTHSERYIPLATNAVRQGMLIAYNLKENQLAYQGTQGTSGLQLFGYTIGSTGLTEGAAKEAGLDVATTWMTDWYRPEFMPTNDKVTLGLVYEKDSHRIVGLQLLSSYDLSQAVNTMSVVIQNEMTVEQLALQDFFFQPHFDRPWNYLNLVALQAMDEMRQQ